MTSDQSAPTSLGSSYWRLWSSTGLSNLADGIFKVALPLIAIQYTRDPALIAGLAVAGGLPWLVFSLYAGAVSDRQDRRVAMVSANVVRASLLTQHARCDAHPDRCEHRRRRRTGRVTRVLQ